MMINSINTQQQAGQPSFKSIAIKNFPLERFGMDTLDFIKRGVAKNVKGGNLRPVNMSDDMYIVDLFCKRDVGIILGKTKAAEEALYKDLMARKAEIPGIEIHKIDDWA